MLCDKGGDLQSFPLGVSAVVGGETRARGRGACLARGHTRAQQRLELALLLDHPTTQIGFVRTQRVGHTRVHDAMLATMLIDLVQRARVYGVPHVPRVDALLVAELQRGADVALGVGERARVEQLRDALLAATRVEWRRQRRRWRRWRRRVALACLAALVLLAAVAFGLGRGVGEIGGGACGVARRFVVGGGRFAFALLFETLFGRRVGCVATTMLVAPFALLLSARDAGQRWERGHGG